MTKQSGINDIPDELLNLHKTQAVATALLQLRKKVFRIWLSLLAVFAAGAICFLMYSRAHMESRAVAHAGNTVKLLQHDLKADIEVVETALRRVAAEYSHLKEGGKSSAGEVTDYLKLQSDSLANFVDDLRVVNENGVITYGHTLGGQQNIAATGLFQSVKNSTGSKLYFSRVTTEGTNGKRIMYVAQRLTGKQGAFAGVICGGITMDRLTKELSEADIGRSGTIMLRDTDMRYLTRFPPPPAENSMAAVALSPQLLKALLGGESRGNVRQLCPIDHIWKLMSFAEVKPYPFFIEVGLSERDVLSSWYSEILFVCLGFAAMVLISGFVVRRLMNDESTRLAAYYDARRSSDNFRDFFDSINRMVIVVDNQGIIVSVNKHALEKLGYGEGELQGTVFELLLVEFCALKSLHGVEMRVRCKDDRTFPVGIFRRVGVWDDTECEFIVMEDQSALNATTTLAERLLGNTSQGIYGTDRHGIVTFINKAALQMTGYRYEDCIGQCMHELIHHHHEDGSFYPAIECPIIATSRTGVPVLLSEEITWRKDGTFFRAEIESHPIFEADIVQGAVVTILDVTVRRQMELEQRKLLSAIEQCPVTIVITDVAGVIEYANPYFTKMSGYSLTDVIGQKPNVLKSGLTSPEIFKELWETLLAGNAWSGEFVNKGKMGNIFYEQAIISPVFDKNGVVTHYLGVKEDITAKKMFMAQLLKAKEDAESGNKAKSEFLATISHEIRTPMNGIMGMTQILLDTELTEEQRGFADIIGKSSDHMMGLISDIFDYSRVNEYKLSLIHTDFDIRELLTDCVTVQKMSADEKGLLLNNNVASDVPAMLRGDPKRLKQVLYNLISNAIKFTPAGQISLNTRVQLDQLGLVVIYFEVVDTGIGVSDEHRQKIFEPFTQGDSSTTRKYGGTGMGLTLSRQIVYLMAGDMGVESQEGAGSTFWFTAMFELPTPEELDAASVGRAVTERAAPAPLKGAVALLPETPVVVPAEPHEIRILLAEDNIINQKVALNLLGKLGYRTDVADDGLLALAALAKTDYDLVLMDCLMPNMDGLQATEVIRDPASAVRNHGVPIIAVTANVLDSDRDRCLAIGMNDYLSKPLKRAELAEVIERWLPKK